ncbi:hypothetical protein BA6E_104133 [Bacteroidales bacterium 6E]|nr:hypothetical protein BA6E_104133 [Bacteroidales bacterium 6E]
MNLQRLAKASHYKITNNKFSIDRSADFRKWLGS